jgi:hypothetical protein
VSYRFHEYLLFHTETSEIQKRSVMERFLLFN